MGNSSPRDLDSTSKLLGNLDLNERRRRRMNADIMDSDLILEVPDTPERLGIMEPSWDSAAKEVNGQFDPLLSNLNNEASRNAYSHLVRDYEYNDVAGSNDTLDDEESLFRRERLASWISKSLETKPSREGHETMPENMQNSILNERGKTSKATDFSQTEPFLLSHPTRSRNLLRKNGKDLLDVEGSESGPAIPENMFEKLFQRTAISSNLPVNTLEEEDSGISCGGNASLKHRGKGKGINLGSHSQAETAQGLARPLQLNASRPNTTQRRLVRNGCISPFNILKNRAGTESGSHYIADTLDAKAISSSGMYSNTNGDAKDLNNGLPTKMGKSCLRQSKFGAPSRKNGQRRLAHNGCTSPNSIVKENSTNDMQMKAGKGERMVLNELSDSNSSRQLYTLGALVEGNCACKDKGKAVMDDNLCANLQHASGNSRSMRVSLSPGMESYPVVDSYDDAVGSPKHRGWRTTRNHSTRSPIFPSCEAASTPKDNAGQSRGTTIGDYVNIDDTPEIETFHRGPCELSSESESEGRRHHVLPKRAKGKRACRSARYHFGGCSASTFDDSEILFLQSPGQPSNSNLTRGRNSQQYGTNISGPVIEVDELSSPVRSSALEQRSLSPDDFSSRDRQVESDEMLARLLQEQFYNESSGFGNSEEIDATIAWSLQQEENAPHNATVSRRGQVHPRDASISHLYAHYPRVSSRGPGRPTIHARVPTASRMAQLMRSFIRPDTDLETRLNFLEALETAFDNRTAIAFPDHYFQAQHNFNENDYEMLLALDDNNHQNVGASDSQINSLPQSVIQSDNFEEACAVCLEIPSVGETIRHLPCLHKFHRDCIDTWLRRKRSCPVCKSSIT